MYVIVFRDDEKSPWVCMPTMYEYIGRAQQALFNFSKGSAMHYDIHKTNSLLDSCHDN